MQELDDSALLRRYTEQDSEESFAALVERHINKVYSIALRHTRNPHQAEEITQAVFVILARKARKLGKGVILAGWLCQTARLAAITFIRSEIRRAHREQEAQMQSLLNETESDAWMRIAPHLDAAMAGLSEADHHAVVLRFFDGKSMKDVGSALGASEDAAKMRVNRAVEKMRRFLTKRGVALSAEGLAAMISAHSVQAAPGALAKSVTALALAKGAVASGSTLALIKGASKLMAWAKVKTAAVASAVVILAGGTTTVAIQAVHAARVSAYPNIQGAWEGVIHFDDAGVAPGEASSSRVVLKLAKTKDGYTATTDWIDKGRKDVPLGRVTYDFPDLRIERNPRDTWKLKINKEATEMVLDHAIHFIQPDPVTLKRTLTPDAVPDRLAESDFAPRAGSDLQGYWKGVVRAAPEPLPVNLKIAEQADGTFRAEGDNPMQGANNQPLSVVYDRPRVVLKLASGAGMFQGEINRANTEITGSWIQGGQSMPAMVRRVDYQAEHAQDALKDYSFNSENDLKGHWRGSWVVTIAKVKATIRMGLDIAKLPDGTYSAAVSNLDEFGHDDPIPASELQYDGPRVRIEWKWAGTEFKGRLKDGKLVGTWFQGGGGFPLVLEREAK